MLRHPRPALVLACLPLLACNRGDSGPKRGAGAQLEPNSKPAPCIPDDARVEMPQGNGPPFAVSLEWSCNRVSGYDLRDGSRAWEVPFFGGGVPQVGDVYGEMFRMYIPDSLRIYSVRTGELLADRKLLEAVEPELALFEDLSHHVSHDGRHGVYVDTTDGYHYLVDLETKAAKKVGSVPPYVELEQPNCGHVFEQIWARGDQLGPSLSLAGLGAFWASGQPRSKLWRARRRPDGASLSTLEMFRDTAMLEQLVAGTYAGDDAEQLAGLDYSVSAKDYLVPHLLDVAYYSHIPRQKTCASVLPDDLPWLVLHATSLERFAPAKLTRLDDAGQEMWTHELDVSVSEFATTGGGGGSSHKRTMHWVDGDLVYLLERDREFYILERLDLDTGKAVWRTEVARDQD